MKKLLLLSTCLLFTAVSGCGLLPAEKQQITVESPEKQDGSSKSNKETENTNIQVQVPIQIQNNNPTNVQQSTPPSSSQGTTSPPPVSGPVSFKKHDFDKEGTGYIPPRQPTGGIWFYTKEDHPGDIAREFNWDTTDVLHFQISDPKYIGYLPEPTKVEIVNGNSVRITVKMVYDADYAKYKMAPRRYLEIPRGIINKTMQMFVVSNTGEPLQTF
ncbi:hypothetical protein [Thermoflavimicrobium dichotomicum]|uniref:Lipoprotein n=1 Tax=Thermoflavimicrobium dichotomicum TaxID=46223 RepID=A0A1I3MDG0_9BACL|nr:hypothetical protein [Thermoflavimicrobium dichotomicum]SFI94755.1 hypothetical protein SAMN05421852_1034 [Thermoflavimicrobium dichotomicum]